MKTLITLVVCLFANTVLAQNMVPNGNFEQYTSCPSSTNQITRCTGWISYCGTTEYYNVCATNWGLSVPTNTQGSQSAASGVAYAGFWIAHNAVSREAIGRSITPLVVGAVYNVSMSVSLADSSIHGISNLGVKFIKNGPTTSSDVIINASTPNVSFSTYGAISNKISWTRLSETFTADSAYDFMAITAWGSYTSYLVDTSLYGDTPFPYYYIDSVVVRLVYGINNLYSDSMVCSGDTFQVSYTVSDSTTYTTGNVFSVQLSNASGSFAGGTSIIGTRTATGSGSIVCTVPSTVTPGNNYRIRIISSNVLDSSLPNQTNISIGVIRPNINSANNSPICSNQQLRLTAASTTLGVNYKWVGPMGFTSVSQNPIISNAVLNNSGNYIVSVRLYGCISTDTTVANISSAVATTINATGSSLICERDTLFLNGIAGTTPNSYGWAGPGGFSSISKDTLRNNCMPAFSGDYILTAYYAGCMIKDTVTVLVKPLPANVNAGANAPVCEGSTLFLTGNTSSSGVSFSWIGPNSFSSTLQSPNFSPATTNRTGNYILAATLNGCSVIDTVYAQVNSIPSKPTASANTPLCIGQDLQLSASTIPSAGYVWGGVGGFNSTLQNPIRTSSNTAYAGKYYVTATVNGCVSSADTVSVVVNTSPVINVYPSPKDSICVGQSVTFVSSTGNAGSSYIRSWFKNNTVIGGAANANYNTTTAADGDEYYVTLTAYGVCATPYTDTSNVIKMHVLPYLAPSVSISANPNTTVTSGTMINFTATPTNGGKKPSYQWTRNGTPVVGATSNVWGAGTLSNNDQICVDMTSNYLCPNPKTAKSNCIKVSIESTGIVGIWTGKAPLIYPNPTNERLTIEGIDKGTIIQLNDVLGRVVTKGTATSETTELNMDHLAAGSYMLLLSKDNGDRLTVKVVKE